MTLPQAAILLAHGLVGWGLCGATMGTALAMTSEKRALVIHAVAAPVIFALISWIYFARFAYTEPLTTAAAFVTLVVVLDLFVVALAVQRSLDMFRSFAGTWLPFALIFLATLGVGALVAA